MHKQRDWWYCTFFFTDSKNLPIPSPPLSASNTLSKLSNRSFFRNFFEKQRLSPAPSTASSASQEFRSRTAGIKELSTLEKSTESQARRDVNSFEQTLKILAQNPANGKLLHGKRRSYWSLSNDTVHLSAKDGGWHIYFIILSVLKP